MLKNLSIRSGLLLLALMALILWVVSVLGVVASLAVRNIELGKLPEGAATAERAGKYAAAAHYDLARFFTAVSQME